MRRLAVGASLALLLAGCSPSSSPQAELQSKMNAITDAANAKDAAQLRGAVSDFLQVVRRQSANNDITLTKAQDLQTIANRLARNASLLEEPDESPTPEPSRSEEPSPSPSPSPSPEPPSPSPSPAESPTAEPSPIVQVSTSPAGGIFSPAATAP